MEYTVRSPLLYDALAITSRPNLERVIAKTRGRAIVGLEEVRSAVTKAIDAQKPAIAAPLL